MARPLRRLLTALALVVLVPLCLLVGLNVFLNTGLLTLVNRQSERLWMGWEHAWTWDLRTVRVEGYAVRVQGPADQWWLSADRASLEVELLPLLQRRFQADAVAAEGVSVRYRRRVDGPVLPGVPAPTFVEGRTAPIPGLENPPLRPPESLYPPPAAPWLIALDGLEVENVRELWLGDYRFEGRARAGGELIVLPGASLDLSGVTAEVSEGLLLLDGIPVLSDLELEAELSLEGADPVHEAGAELFRHLDGRAELNARVEDFRHIDIFLANAPWVGISSGSGTLSATLVVDQGTFRPGTAARGVLQDAGVRFGSYEAVGAGEVRVAVDRDARLSLDLDAFAVFQGGGGALVTGRGFTLEASTPRLAIDSPPMGFTATATLPRSRVPDLARFDTFLPSRLGFRVLGGSATIEGRARVEEDGDHVSGHVSFEATGARIRYDDLPVSGSLKLEGRVVRGSLDRGTYDIRGSALTLRDVSIGRSPPTWRADLRVREGKVAAGAPTFLSAKADISCSDSSPFFRLAVGERKIAPWIEELLLLEDLRGDVVASFGQTSVRFDHLQIGTRKAEVHLHLAQEPNRFEALLFARLGLLGVATHVKGEDYMVQLINAKRWFHARLAKQGTPEPWTNRAGVQATDRPTDERRGLKIFGKDIRRLFERKEERKGERKQGAR